jgi:hypothetical protein
LAAFLTKKARIRASSDLRCVVGRGVVDNDDFIGRVKRTSQRFQAALEIHGIVAHWNDD